MPHDGQRSRFAVSSNQERGSGMQAMRTEKSMILCSEHSAAKRWHVRKDMGQWAGCMVIVEWDTVDWARNKAVTAL